MSTKLSVLKILEEKKGQTISGEELANHLEVSRAAIWKAIKELRKEGYAIDAITNKGYCLTEDNDRISVQGILPHLQSANMEEKVFVYKLLESTNLTAKKMALDGAAPGTVVIAEEQSKGRGRMGRSFYSPADSGIYMSLILKPGFDVAKSVLITTAASVAVCKAIEKVTGIRCEIKWVNDIYMKGKKICGILTEAVTDFESGHIEHIILGIGINFTTAKVSFPEELKDIAGSLFHKTEDLKKTGTKQISRNQLIAEVINEVLSIHQDLESRSFIPEYKERSFVLGKEINIMQRISSSSGSDVPPPVPATAVDIDSDGGLVVRYEDGSTDTLNSGEISIRLRN
ncbi:biotin--[acetyl-CoA-carboxylase] ligase [Sinanaerobacter chloroacetimidivorans]|jgi:BirA family biotin operon repressor/biotin-[acetyl-CoA-carboxylase] ligase|uniref:Bifunctional ligase/repressor BirA n=1 Tax=Sinanaerobacter chloroacetimidivorans TaxID=2818044 RepID=A0A8J7W524_9FIRM|nr:biotin--[acetyl-CoA-carboxylase] ligase [Sinanaerobacter chloroacetimidivorans]MBR0599090.1 biotin--[acetyl-CoA-carboxylase] ligase [Sinanaerobacter chloroacetimidivorans]